MSALSGVLLVDKPPGPTSHDLVARVRKVTGIRRVGHAGTLDPFASGLMLLLLGSATRLSEYLIGMDKTYEATVRLGVETTSGDIEGDIVEEHARWDELTPDQIASALAGLTGRVLQQPPVYSAKKVNGEPAHRRTRRGENVVLQPTEVMVHELTVREQRLPFLHLFVRCSSGTYVRMLAQDLGRALGVGGHLSALRRLTVGSFSVAQAAPVEVIRTPDAVRERLLPGSEALSAYPAVELSHQEADRIRHGQALQVRWEPLPEAAPIRLLLGGDLLAVGVREEGWLKPRKVFA